MNLTLIWLFIREQFGFAPTTDGVVGGLNRTVKKLNKVAEVQAAKSEWDLKVSAKLLADHQKRRNEASQARAVSANIRNLLNPAVDTSETRGA